jgi:hypothetical protein
MVTMTHVRQCVARSKNTNLGLDKSTTINIMCLNQGRNGGLLFRSNLSTYVNTSIGGGDDQED